MQEEAQKLGNMSAGAGLFGARVAKWCTYLLIAFPILDYALRMSVVHPLGSIWDKVVLLILALIAFTRFLRGYRIPAFGWYKFAGWFILYTFVLMLVGLGHPTIAFAGWRMDIYYIVFGLLLPFVIDREDIPKFLHVAATVAILIGVSGVFQYVLKPEIPSGWVDVTEHVRTRVFSVIKSPNELGAYMALMIPVVFGLFMAETHRIRRWLYGIGILFCLMTLLFTYTRGAWMALLVAVLIIAVIYERRLLVVLILLGVIGYFLPAIHHRVGDLFSPVYWIQSAKGGRILRWVNAFDQMSTNPLFGVGLGHFGGAVASQYGYSIYSDNYYAKTLGETGLVGLVLFLAMHAAIVWEFVRTTVRRAKGRNKFLALGGLTGITAVLVHNMIENVFEYAPMILAYFVLVSLFLVWGRTLPSEEGKHED